MHLAELLATAGGLDHDHPERTAAPRPPRTAKAAAFWVRQLNLLARTTAPGAASRSRGSRARSAQASLTSPWLTWKPKLPARPQQPVSRCSAWAPAAVSSFSSASQPGTACWCQCTWVSTGRRTAAGVYPGGVLGEQLGQGERVVAKPEHAAVERRQVVEHSESTRPHGRNRRRPGRRRGGPLGAHPRRRSRGSSAGSSGKRCLLCWWWDRRGSNTDLMDPRDRPRSRRKGPADLLAQHVAERLIDILVQAVDINALLQMVDLNALLGRVDVNTPLKEVDLNALLERVDVNTPLKQVDLNTPLKQVDLNALLKQVDLNALLKQVDLNEVLEQVDVDAVLDRVDINDVVARIDMERLVEQTDLGAIIARSTGGLATQALDTMRSGAVGLDRRIDRWVTRLLRRKERGPLAPPALLGLEAQP